MLRAKLLIGLLALWSASFQQGCQDLTKSLTHWSYYPIRDMRQTVVIDPQRGDPLGPQWTPFRGPDSTTVSNIDTDRWVSDPPYALADAHLIAPAEEKLDSAVVRGDTLFHMFCWTCHGMKMAGDGPVAAQFMPPPDLLAEATRKRTDGYIYMYMRHGGVVMPSYGNAVSSRDAWDIVHYIRSMQKTSPR